MNIKIKFTKAIKEIDDTQEMAHILKTIADDLENGLIDGFYKDFEFHYIDEEVK